MWQPAYIRSLAPLQDALNKMGPSTQLENLSLAMDNVEERNLSYAVDIVANVPSMLEFLVDRGFFSVFGELPAIARELRTIWLHSCEWEVSEAAELTKGTLAPIFELLFCLAPNKTYDVLWYLKGFLEEAGGDGWEGENCLEYLTRIQQDLEEMEPKSTLNYLEQLHDVLVSQRRRLAWLSRHPLIEEELGEPNLFDTLMAVSKTLCVGMDDYSCCLIDLQDVLEDLNKVQAIVRHPGDLEE